MWSLIFPSLKKDKLRPFMNGPCILFYMCLRGSNLACVLILMVQEFHLWYLIVIVIGYCLSSVCVLCTYTKGLLASKTHESLGFFTHPRLNDMCFIVSKPWSSEMSLKLGHYPDGISVLHTLLCPKCSLGPTLMITHLNYIFEASPGSFWF